MSTHFNTDKNYALPSLIVAGLGVLAILIAASSCGRQAYQVVSTSEQQQAPGTFSVPPKVDIILAEDNNGAMFESYAQVAAQFPAWLSGLQSSGWDYHFAGIPLSTDEPITQAFASTYDSNWGSSWTPAYPGEQQWITTPSGGQALPPDMLSSSVFTIPGSSSNAGFIQATQISNASGGLEQGFQTIWDALSNRVNGTGVVRPDALLVVMSLAVTEDTSLVNQCIRQDGEYVYCEAAGVAPCTGGTAPQNYVAGYHSYTNNFDGVCGTYQQSESYYQTLYQGYKSSPSQFKFFSAVAGESLTGDGCIGTNSFQSASATRRCPPYTGGTERRHLQHAVFARF